MITFCLTLVSACIRVGIYYILLLQLLLPASISSSSSLTSKSSTTTRPKLYERNQKLAKLYYEESLLHYDENNSSNSSHNGIDNKQYDHNSLPYIRAAVRLDPYNIDYLSLLIDIEESLDIRNKISQRKQKLSLLLSHNYTNFDDIYINNSLNDDFITKSVIHHVTFSYIKQIITRMNSHCNMKLCSNSDDDDYDDSYSGGGDKDRLRFDLLSRPFVIHTKLHREIVPSSSSTTTTTTPLSLLQRLNETYFNTPIEFYPHNLLQSSSFRYNISLDIALEFLLSPEGAYFSVDISDPGTYIQWNLNQTVYDDIINNNYYFVNSNLSNVEDEHSRIMNNNNDDDDDDDNNDDSSCNDSNLLSILNDFFSPNSQLFSSLLSSSSSSSLKTNNPSTITSDVFEDFFEKTHWRMLLIGEFITASIVIYLQSISISSYLSV